MENKENNIRAEATTVSTLKVGDKIYCTHYGRVNSVSTIERLTRTQAICGQLRFDVEFSSSGYVSKKGSWDQWSSASYFIETDELKEQLFRQNAIAKIQHFKYSELPTEKLKQILDIIAATL